MRAQLLVPAWSWSGQLSAERDVLEMLLTGPLCVPVPQTTDGAQQVLRRHACTRAHAPQRTLIPVRGRYHIPTSVLYADGRLNQVVLFEETSTVLHTVRRRSGRALPSHSALSCTGLLLYLALAVRMCCVLLYLV